MQTEDEIQSVDGIPVMTEPIGFSAEELIACSKCAKRNPPNRLNCFYCGAALVLPTEVAAGIPFRPAEIEEWEPGVNIIIVGDMNTPAIDAVGAAVVLDRELLETAANSGSPIPLIRVRPDEADEVASRLSAAGIAITNCSDKAFNHHQPPARLKGIHFGHESVEFILFNADEVVRIDPAEIALIVTGVIFKASSEATLKTKRKETKQVDEKFAASDHAVIDIYTANDRHGFRILPHGFDFSCLGTRKSLLAVDNIRRLTETLRTSFPNAVFDDSYITKLAVLDQVWPRTVANTSKGMHRVGFKVERSIGESVSNEEQFTRYSRMRRELI